ncbi:MAG: hypothetical protein ABIG11_08155 [bacterium]
MPVTQILAYSERDRREIAGILAGLGCESSPAATLNNATDVIEKVRPRVVFIAEDSAAPPCPVMIKELMQFAPLVPLIVFLRERDSARAVEYMRSGAFDCIAPPWTADAVRPVLRKALNISGTGLSLARPRSQLRKKLPFIAVLTALLLSGAFYLGRFHARRKMAVVPALPGPYSWNLPYSHPSGLAWDGKSLRVSDWYSQSVYEHDPVAGMRLLSVAHLPSAVPSGLTFGEGVFWMAVSGHIEKRMRDAKLTLLGRTRFQGERLSGLCHDGLYLWTVDAKQGRLRRHLTDSELTVTRTWQSPAANPAALACGPAFLWLADASSRELLTLPLDDPETVLSRKSLPQYRDAGLKITGLASDGKRFWSSAEGKNKGMLFLHDFSKNRPVHTGGD